MIKIDVDREVIEQLGKIAIPFVETNPNMVIRRLLGLSFQTAEADKTDLAMPIGIGKLSNSAANVINPSPGSLSQDGHKIIIDNLRDASSQTHPAFLTFLMDKYQNTKGNYKISDIMEFMGKVNLHYSGKIFRNPWMKESYGGDKNGLVSCQRTIEHFKQARKFGCWGGRDDKTMCDSYQCQYHPKNDTKLQNKCDLRYGVIWKRSDPDSPFSYSEGYLKTVKNDLLKNKTMPLEPLLNVFYPGQKYTEELIEIFGKHFHFNNADISALFSR